MTFGESLVFLVALLSGILDSIAGGAGAGHGDNLGTSSIGISALNQYRVCPNSLAVSSPSEYSTFGQSVTL